MYFCTISYIFVSGCFPSEIRVIFICFTGCGAFIFHIFVVPSIRGSVDQFAKRLLSVGTESRGVGAL